MSQLEEVTDRYVTDRCKCAGFKLWCPGVLVGDHTHVTIRRSEHEYGGAELGVPASRLGVHISPEATTRVIYREIGSLRVERFNLRLSSSAEPHA
jgi:hypothetical protein